MCTSWRRGPRPEVATVLDSDLGECSRGRATRTSPMVEFATLVWVDWFNHRRLLEPIGYVPPAEYESRYYEQTAVA